jgi:hypothetical protein
MVGRSVSFGLVLASLVACTGGGATQDVTTPAPTGAATPAVTAENPTEAHPLVVGYVHEGGSDPGGGVMILPGTVTTPDPPPEAMPRGKCDAIADGGALMAGSDAITGVLHCGDVVLGHTRGGVTRYDTAFYEHATCTPATTKHESGDERIYKLELPNPQTRALVYLDTPCADLDLGAMFGPQDAPPAAYTEVSRCEMNQKPRTARESVDLWNDNAANWWIVVEGKDAEEGAFALTVQCVAR